MNKYGQNKNCGSDYKRLFLYKTGEWKALMERTESEDGKYDLTIELALGLTNAFGEGMSVLNESNLRRFLKYLNHFAASVVVPSAGIVPNFRLAKNWFQVVVAQILIVGGDIRGEGDSCRANVKKLYTSLGWDHVTAITPVSDDIQKNLPFYYGDKNDPMAQFEIVLEPTSEFPIGSSYESSKGKIWHVVGWLFHGISLVDDEVTTKKNGDTFHKNITVTEKQLRDMKRIL